VDTISSAAFWNTVASELPYRLALSMNAFDLPKAPSPLRSAGALHIAPAPIKRSFHL